MSELTGTKGGSGVWQRIISEMPAHKVYIEPFWGRGTIAAKKRPAKVTIGIDRAPDAMASGRALGAIMFLGDGVQWIKDYFRLSSPAAGSSVAAAGDGRRRVGARVTRAPTTRPASVDRATRAPASRSPAATFGGISLAEHFVYLDPPYLYCSGYYKHELSESQHIDLCRTFLALPCPAALSGYWTKVYAKELAGCRYIKIPTVNRRGQRIEEILWMNYPQPARYHDTRYVGTCRRVRERIRRRVKNWQAGMANMQPNERQAVWEACDDVFNGTTRLEKE